MLSRMEHPHYFRQLDIRIPAVYELVSKLWESWGKESFYCGAFVYFFCAIVTILNHLKCTLNLNLNHFYFLFAPRPFKICLCAIVLEKSPLFSGAQWLPIGLFMGTIVLTKHFYCSGAQWLPICLARKRCWGAAGDLQCGKVGHQDLIIFDNR